MKIRAVNLTRVFHIGLSRIAAVNDVNLEVNEEKFIAVIGPSGSGKSTLLNLLGLNDYPTSGKMLIDSKDTALLSKKERRKIRLFRIGFVFQTFNLLSTLSALENVELPMSLAGKPLEDQREKAVKLLENVGLAHRLDHRPKELSVGEMQRVAIARSLINNPELIIADEPTGELDSKRANEIVDLLFDLKKRHKTTIIVATHDQEIVEPADEIYKIMDGKLSHR
ncbi:MAG: ABC transporter ATP-binding protein [Candidatus Bathyarchaeota archaeon]|nr:MAG: ABC transporter ATP-binding protein [Candidatus Bathyarchaeota archaeon]